MICNKCNNEIKPDETFCGKCGTKVIIQNSQTEFNNENDSQLNSSQQNINFQQLQPNVQNSQFMNEQQSQLAFSNSQSTLEQKNQPNSNYYNSQNNYNSVNKAQQKKNSKNTTSIILGIISLALVFIFLIFVWPISIVGIVFGALALKENKKNKIGLILNIISLVIAIPLLMLYTIDSEPNNAVIGTWNCKSFDGTVASGNYIITMILNNDNQFSLNKYNDARNNYAIGTYTFKDLHKTNNNGTTNYYQLTLNGDEFVNNGDLQSEVYNSTYEIGIIKDTAEAILMNTQTYNSYYCYKSNTLYSKDESTYSNDYDKNKENNMRINRLTYSLPSNLTEGSMNTDTYKSYSYINTNSFCKFRVTTYDLYDSLTTQKYFEDYVYNDEKDLSKIYTKTFNGTNWHMLDVDDQYSKNKYGVYIDDKTAYGIEFLIIDDPNNECERLYNSITESIKID